MKRCCLLVLTSLLCLVQLYPVTKLEKLLQKIEFPVSEEDYGTKMSAARQILRIDPVNITAIDFICTNWKIDEVDSIQPLLDKLIAVYPNNKNVYLLKARYLYCESNDLSDQAYAQRYVHLLGKAYQLDSTDVQINYLLAEAYYRDFLLPYEKYEFGIGTKIPKISNDNKTIRKHSFLSRSGEKALFHFNKAAQYGTDSIRQIVYFPMQQLKYALYHKSPEKLHYPISLTTAYDYPVWEYVGLKKNWYKDLSKNYLIMMEWVAEADYNQTCFMRSIGEPNLKRQKISGQDETIRLSWFRSFRSDLFVKLEKKGNEYLLRWRECGWSVSKVKDSVQTGQRVVSQEEFFRYTQWLNKSGFDHLTGYCYVPMCDGDCIIMERATRRGIQVLESNMLPNNFRKVCYLLVSMTTIRLDNEYNYQKSGTQQEVEHMRKGTAGVILAYYAMLGFGVIVIVIVFFLFIYNFKSMTRKPLRNNGKFYKTHKK